MDTTTRAALRLIADHHRNLAAALDDLLAAHPATSTGSAQPEAEGAEAASARPVWDPQTDEPLVHPKVLGTREEQDWCSLTYLGGIYAINRRLGRGAAASEIRHFAIKAGYQDGRAVTAWSKGSGPTFNDGDKQRWITPEGVDFWVRGLAGKLGVILPADLSEPWAGPEGV